MARSETRPVWADLPCSGVATSMSLLPLASRAALSRLLDRTLPRRPDRQQARPRCSLPLRPVRRCSRPGVQPARTSASVHQSGPVRHALSEAPGSGQAVVPSCAVQRLSRFRAMRSARRRRARAQ
jgi:hypothetical protein